MHRSVPGAVGRRRGSVLRPVLVALVLLPAIVAACGPAPSEATFGLSIRNSGSVPLRLKVLPAPGGEPTEDLLVPGKSGIMETETGPTGVTDGKPGPVTVEIYTDTCALITAVTVGEGRTLIVIDEAFGVTTTAGVSGNEGAVEPEVVPGC